jgi:CRISPR system Cascade subunit CasB
MSSLLDRLRRCADNRGMMANLRCILIESKKHRAWPVLNRIGIDINQNVGALIAGLYATHPEEATSGNLGTVCKVIEMRRGEKRSDDNKLTATERRFQHLLAAEKGEEINGRVIRMILMAKSQGVPVNYEQLEKDLSYWNDRTKTEWASAFWTPGAESVPEEEVA